MKKFLMFLSMSVCVSLTGQEIEGKVLHAFSHTPIPGAIVAVPNSSISIRTDSLGYFRISGATVPLDLHISASGFEPLWFHMDEIGEKQVFFLVPAEQVLSEIVVRSSLIPKRLMDTPASVGVLSAADLERTDGTSLPEALEQVPGLYVQQGALNTTKMSIRGVGSRSPYSTTRLKAYFMGIPLTSAEGVTTLDDLDPSDIGKAEIIKGPASSMYGAGLGGAINLYPRVPPEEGTEVNAQTTFGSFGLMDSEADLSHVTEDAYFSLSYHKLTSDGFRDNGEYRRNSLLLHGQISGGARNSLTFLGLVTRLKAYIPSALNLEDLQNDPGAAADTWEAARGYESYDKGLVGLSYKHRYASQVSGTTTVYLNFRNGFEPRPFDILDEEQIGGGIRTKYNLEESIWGLDYKLSLGGEYYREWYDISTRENLYEAYPEQGSVAGNFLSHNKQVRQYYNLFAQGNIDLSPRVQLEAGINLNVTSYELVDRYQGDSIDQTGSYRFPRMLSPRIGMVYELADRKNIYLSVSHGFSTPGVAQTLTPEGLINTQLGPETGVNYELGFKGHFLDQLYSEVAVYSTQINDLLVAERVAEDQYVGRNAGKTDHQGLEMLLRYTFRLSPYVEGRAFLNAAFNDFRFDDFKDNGIDHSGNSLPGVPDKSVHAGIDMTTSSGISLRVLMQHEGSMALDDSNSGYTDSYNLMNLKASWSPTFFDRVKVSVFAGINNVLDKAYVSSIVPNAVGFGGASPRYYYPGKPRNLYGGMSFKMGL